MTYEELRQLRDAINAKLAGKPFQYRTVNGEWRDTDEMDIRAGRGFRPKPEPISRPWDFNSRPREVVWVYLRGFITDSMVVAWGDDVAMVATKRGMKEVSYGELFHAWLQRDGSPCETTEEPC